MELIIIKILISAQIEIIRRGFLTFALFVEGILINQSSHASADSLCLVFVRPLMTRTMNHEYDHHHHARHIPFHYISTDSCVRGRHILCIKKYIYRIIKQLKMFIYSSILKWHMKH